MKNLACGFFAYTFPFIPYGAYNMEYNMALYQLELLAKVSSTWAQQDNSLN